MLPSNLNVVVGKPLNLQAQVDGRPLPDVEWFKDGVPLKPSEHVKFGIKPDGTITLEIKQARPEDTGKYELRATCPAGKFVTASDVVVGGNYNNNYY